MTPETPPETTLETVSRPNSASPHADPSSSAPRLRQAPRFARRLPRFHRAKGSHRPRLALQDRDLDLLRTAHEYRLITTPQFLLLFSGESKDGIYNRLQKLFHRGYLDRLGTNPNAPMLHALGRRGAEVLEVSSRKEVGDRYVAHQLMIGDVRIAFVRAAKDRGIDFTWRRFPEGTPVRPDGFFSLQFPELPEGRNRTFFMLEADRSTMTRERFVEKLVAYQRWFEAGGHTAALGIKSFRVLTVTKSEERLRSLLDAVTHTHRLTPRAGRYWFASQCRYAFAEPGVVLTEAWTNSSNPEVRRGLLPQVQPTG